MVVGEAAGGGQGTGVPIAPQPVDHSRDVFSIANVITVLRLVLVPFFFWFLVFSPPPEGPNHLAFAVFVLAAGTDWLDGYIARTTGSVTAIGKVIDPLVDRLLIAFALIGLVAVRRVPLWLMVVLIGRDVYLLYGAWVLERHGRRVGVTILGKVTTAVLMIGFASLIWNAPLVPSVAALGWLGAASGRSQALGTYVVYAGTVLSACAAVQYTVLARREYVKAVAEEHAGAAEGRSR